MITSLRSWMIFKHLSKSLHFSSSFTILSISVIYKSNKKKKQDKIWNKDSIKQYFIELNTKKNPNHNICNYQ